jgi:alkanesulfonate monooxygenase SsuD/methylene tetrahydromethanopterin reductase-like flavin-dependent oxidoreductase (luciferase family)
MKLGYLPPMTKGITTDPHYVIPFVEMLEGAGVESVWMVEHVVVADDYEPLYPYSEDGRMPAGPDTQMPDPLEWLAFAAARTDRLRLGTSVLIASQHSAVILAKRVATLDALSGGRLTLGVASAGRRRSTKQSAYPTAIADAASTNASSRCVCSGRKISRPITDATSTSKRFTSTLVLLKRTGSQS